MPQGTVLVPILFIIYINNILSFNIRGALSSFADGTIIFYESETWEELSKREEIDMVKIADAFNFDK